MRGNREWRKCHPLPSSLSWSLIHEHFRGQEKWVADPNSLRKGFLAGVKWLLPPTSTSPPSPFQTVDKWPGKGAVSSWQQPAESFKPLPKIVCLIGRKSRLHLFPVPGVCGTRGHVGCGLMKKYGRMSHGFKVELWQVLLWACLVTNIDNAAKWFVFCCFFCQSS